MFVTKRITMDLARSAPVPCIPAVQGDAYTRKLEVALRQNGTDWAIPDGTSVVVRYQKPDGTSGAYDTLPDGEQAWSVSENVVTVALAPQMLTAAGMVSATVSMVLGEQLLSTFPIRVEVGPQIGGEGGSEPYAGWRWAYLPQVARAKEGQFLQIQEVDEKGRVVALKPVDGTGDDSQSSFIPSYWLNHLEEKIETIRSLQEAGGQDCFSFPVLTDLHIDANLGMRSPELAKYVMEQCGMKYALCLGDVFTRGVKWTKEEADEHYAQIENLLSPLRSCLLQTQGNHDGVYGAGDYDGDGDTDVYLYNYTPQQMFERIYRKVGLVGNVHFDPNGSNAYYIDDTASRVRFIVLNTHCTQWAEDENGLAKYNNMSMFRYTQKQYDFLAQEALVTGLEEGWQVVIGSHVPIHHSGEMPEGEVMVGFLNAYKNKTTYSGAYAGTAEGGGQTADFTNLNDPSDGDFLDDHKFNTSSDADENPIIEWEGGFVSGYIPATSPNKESDVIRFTGIDTAESITAKGYDADHNLLMTTVSTLYDDFSIGDDGIVTWKAGYVDNYISTANANALAYIRISATKLTTAEAIIITKNEEITYTEAEGDSTGFDAVSVDVDFSQAKGDLTAYFGGHVHADNAWDDGFPVISTRCDAQVENNAELKAERIKGTATEQSFDVFTVNKAKRKIYATKIGAGEDRVIRF